MENGDSKKQTAILEEILAAVTRKPEFDDNVVSGLLNHLVAEAGKHTRGSIAIHGQVSLYISLKPGDKLVFAVQNGNQGTPIFSFDIKKPVTLGKYRIGLFLIPENT